MRIFYICCLTILGLFLVFTQLIIFNGGVSIQQISMPMLPTMIWNLVTLTIGIFIGSALMGNLVEGYYKYYDLFQNQKSVLINARDRLKDIENKYSAIQVEKDLHILALQKAEQIDDMVRAIEIQYGGRSQTKVDLTEYIEAKQQLWKEVFNYGK